MVKVGYRALRVNLNRGGAAAGAKRRDEEPARLHDATRRRAVVAHSLPGTASCLLVPGNSCIVATRLSANERLRDYYLGPLSGRTLNLQPIEQ